MSRYLVVLGLSSLCASVTASSCALSQGHSGAASKTDPQLGESTSDESASCQTFRSGNRKYVVEHCLDLHQSEGDPGTLVVGGMSRNVDLKTLMTPYLAAPEDIYSEASWSNTYISFDEVYEFFLAPPVAETSRCAAYAGDVIFREGDVARVLFQERGRLVAIHVEPSEQGVASTHRPDSWRGKSGSPWFCADGSVVGLVDGGKAVTNAQGRPLAFLSVVTPLQP